MAGIGGYIKNNIADVISGVASPSTMFRHAGADAVNGMKKTKLKQSIKANTDANKTGIVSGIMEKGRNSKSDFVRSLVPGQETTGKVFQSVNDDSIADAMDYVSKTPSKPRVDTGNPMLDEAYGKLDDYYREIAGSRGQTTTVIDPDGSTFDIAEPGALNGGKAGYHRDKSNYERARSYFGDEVNGKNRKIAAGAGIGAVAIGAGLISNSSEDENGLKGAAKGAGLAGAGIYGAIASASRRL